jgi:hypothetical protein
MGDPRRPAVGTIRVTACLLALTGSQAFAFCPRGGAWGRNEWKPREWNTTARRSNDWQPKEWRTTSRPERTWKTVDWKPRDWAPKPWK